MIYSKLFISIRRVTVVALLVSSCAVFAEDTPSPATQAAQLIQEQKYKDAEALLEKALKAKAADAEALYRLAEAEILLEKSEKAVANMEKAIALDSKQARFHHMLGRAYGAQAAHASIFSALSVAKKCIAAFEKAVQMEPDNLAFQLSCYDYYRASPSIANGGLDKAAAAAAKIEKLDPVQGAGLRADLAVEDKKIDEAFHIMDDLKNRFPDNKVVLFILGRTAASSGLRLDQGETALKSYLTYQPAANEPQLWAAHFQLGMLQLKRGAKAAARLELTEAFRLNPEYEPARIILKNI